jgi:hypothetical protein
MGNAAAMFRNPSPQSPGVQQKPQARNGLVELQAGELHFIDRSIFLVLFPEVVHGRLQFSICIPFTNNLE